MARPRTAAVRPGRARTLADAHVELDLGGCAKGYAVDRAAEALRAHGVRDGLVNVGGDLVALGRSEDGDGWRVGVRDPADPSRLRATLSATDEAVATSGDYERCFVHRGRRHHHLLDLATAAPRIGTRHRLTLRAPVGWLAVCTPFNEQFEMLDDQIDTLTNYLGADVPGG